MKQTSRFGFVLGSVLALVGCASVDSKNSDARPWNRPLPPEMSTSCWSWWPGLFSGSACEEEQWLHARQSFGR